MLIPDDDDDDDELDVLYSTTYHEKNILRQAYLRLGISEVIQVESCMQEELLILVMRWVRGCLIMRGRW